MEELGIEQRLRGGIWKSRVENNTFQVKRTIQNTQHVRKGTLNDGTRKNKQTRK